jgi:hypothetical protein
VDIFVSGSWGLGSSLDLAASYVSAVLDFREDGGGNGNYGIERAVRTTVVKRRQDHERSLGDWEL